jgi:hypothetical protein
MACIDGDAGEHRRVLHGPPRVEVVGTGDSIRQVPCHEIDRLHRRCSHAAAGTTAGHRLDGVDERVEAGRRGHVRRHRHGEGRIEHDQRRQQLLAPGPRLATGGVGQHGRPGDLRARARRRRNGHDGWSDRQRRGAEQVALDAELSGADGGGELGRVQRRPTAGAHHDRVVDGADDLGGCVDRGDRGLATRDDVDEGRPGDAEEPDDRVDPPDHDLVGDDHGAALRKGRRRNDLALSGQPPHARRD